MKIICFYHCPCLDGAFSVLTLFTFLKTANNSKSIGFIEFYKKLLHYPTKIKEESTNFPNENKEKTANLMEIEEIKEEKSAFIEKEDIFSSFFGKPEEFKDFIEFFGVKPSKNSENFLSIIKNLKKNLIPEETIIILLDYYGESFENIEFLSKYSRKIIIIDHHQTFFDAFQQKSNEKITIFGNIANSACVLTYKFFLETFVDILPIQISQKLLTFLPFIEDHDIKSRKYPGTEAIITAFHELIKDFSIFSNSLLFFSLMKYDISILKELGAPILSRKLEKVCVLLNNKRKTVININEISKISCFSLKISNNSSQDKALINEIGEALAEASIIAKMDNIGIVFIELKEGFRVCMRGVNTFEETPCLLLAKYLGGGGHKYAAGGWVSTKMMKKWLKN